MDVEMNLIIDYNFAIMEDLTSPPRKKCISPDHLAQRLWNNFIWKGYIHPEIKYQPLNSGGYKKVKLHFNNQIAKARSEGKKRPDLLKRAKDEFKRKAYLSLSENTLKGIFKRFKLDFELFDFEREKQELISLLNS